MHMRQTVWTPFCTVSNTISSAARGAKSRNPEVAGTDLKSATPLNSHWSLLDDARMCCFVTFFSCTHNYANSGYSLSGLVLIYCVGVNEANSLHALCTVCSLQVQSQSLYYRGGWGREPDIQCMGLFVEFTGTPLPEIPSYIYSYLQQILMGPSALIKIIVWPWPWMHHWCGWARKIATITIFVFHVQEPCTLPIPESLPHIGYETSNIFLPVGEFRWT